MQGIMILFSILSSFYRPPTELREGNVFSCVCQSFCLSTGGGHVTITRDAWTSL